MGKRTGLEGIEVYWQQKVQFGSSFFGGVDFEFKYVCISAVSCCPKWFSMFLTVFFFSIIVYNIFIYYVLESLRI